MKKIFLSILFVSGLFVTSCKDKENNESENKKEVVLEKPFTVELVAKFSEDDVTCLYYKDLSISFFNEDMAVYKNVTKSETAQTITFELPKDFLPNDFRFDLSHQNKNNKIQIEKITFYNEGKNFVISKEDLLKYFRLNEGIKYDEASNTFSFQEVNGLYDPHLITTGMFYPLLESLVGYKAFDNKVENNTK